MCFVYVVFILDFWLGKDFAVCLKQLLNLGKNFSFGYTLVTGFLAMQWSLLFWLYHCYWLLGYGKDFTVLVTLVTYWLLGYGEDFTGLVTFVIGFLVG